MTSNKVASNDQILDEAYRRYRTENVAAEPVLRDGLDHFIIEVVREGWTPPEPVDPDLLAFREWVSGTEWATQWAIEAGKWDDGPQARAYLAGARMATERERERMKDLVEFAEEHAMFMPDGIIAKIRGEA